MSHLFISYSRWDRRSTPLIDRLIADLQKNGVHMWLSPDSVEPGTDFQAAIGDAIQQAAALLYLSGTRSKNAKGMLRELAATRTRAIPDYVAVVTADGLENAPADAPVFDFTKNYAAAFQALLLELPSAVKTVAASQTAKKPEPRSKGYVFISYAEEDTTFVNRLRSFLKERGYGYWDYQDSERNYHTALHLELEDVIREASATISVLSPAWKQSKWTAREFLFSEEIGTPVFLVMADVMEPTLVIAGIPYIDFTRDADLGFSRLDKELRRKGLI